MTPPEPRTDLPRLDITGFVGFAEQGPFDTPVLIEDVLRFRQVFGGDVALTEASAGAPPLHSFLGASVEAYFANGGVVCWVVRVGDGAAAETTRFRVPGLVGFDDGGRMQAVEVEARSPGSGFDGHEAIGWIRRRRLPLPFALVFDAGGGVAELPRSARLRPGDLLEVDIENGPRLWTFVDAIDRAATDHQIVSWATDREYWSTVPGDASESNIGGSIDGTTLTAEEVVTTPDGAVEVITPDDVDADIGSILQLDAGPSTGRRSFVVDREPGRTATGRRRLHAVHGRQRSDGPTARATAEVNRSLRCSVITIGIGARIDDELVAAIDGLGVAATAKDSWHDLRADAELFGDAHRRAATGGEHPVEHPIDALVESPRFPFGAGRPDQVMVLPLHLTDDPVLAIGGMARTSGASSFTRNGVDTMSASWFIDPAVPGEAIERIRLEAPRRFFIDEEPLSGALALYPLDDIAVVVAPDAVHLGWSDRVDPTGTPLPPPLLRVGSASNELIWEPYGWVVDDFELETAPVADFSSAVERRRTTERRSSLGPPACETQWSRIRARRGDLSSPWSNTVVLDGSDGSFVACTIAAWPMPVLELSGGAVRFRLDPGVPDPVTFEIDSSDDPLFAGSQLTRFGPTGVIPHVDHAVTPPASGVRFWRARINEPGEAPGPWSNTTWIEAVPGQTRMAEVFDGKPAAATVGVHRHLAALAAARQDLTVLISFPRPYRPTHVAEHLEQVASDSFLAGNTDRTWSDYLHAHHPWIGVARGDGRRWVPADGAIAGRLAESSLRRGPWIASVIDPLRGVIGVDGPDLETSLALRDLQVNAFSVRRERVFATGVDTLSPDPTVLPVTVRRLLIVLRRLARREGRLLVFENNGPLLWRIMRRRFEAVLDDLLMRGALAGRSPSEAYRVICDGSTNGPNAIDNGRLTIELHVAPAHPLEFLEVRLTQTDAGGFEFEWGVV